MAGLGVYLIEVGSAARIVNLVASEARNRIASGITIAFQLRPRGCVVELRRTRNLEKPDLARLLLDMDATLFVARGGHPMAAGATVAPTKEEVFFAELRAKLEHEVAAP
jgi:nanoRNase/pAp phosphatase (c-di-AMP/oligoRNAs hydrolase)